MKCYEADVEKVRQWRRTPGLNEAPKLFDETSKNMTSEAEILVGPNLNMLPCGRPKQKKKKKKREVVHSTCSTTLLLVCTSEFFFCAERFGAEAKFGQRKMRGIFNPSCEGWVGLRRAEGGFALFHRFA